MLALGGARTNSLLGVLFSSVVAAWGCAGSPAASVASRAESPADRTQSAPTSAPSPAPATPGEERPWVTSLKPELRRLTVLVRVKPAPALIAKYTELAARYPRLAPLFRAASEGGFGSGVVVARRDAKAGVRTFVVTNRHVVDLSSQVSVSFEGDGAPFEAPVVFVHPSYDLAVLSLHAPSGAVSDRQRIPSEGFDFEAQPAKDQQPVAASGYPGIGNSPSYQVTRGFVSNERFEISEGTAKLVYLQHTAPVDPGSSGGPLTTMDGKLLGINTLKVRQRENVALAVPASVAAEAVEQAALAGEVAKAPNPESGGREACKALVQALSGGADHLGAIERAIGSTLVANEGLASLAELPRGEDDWAQAFLESPTQVFVHAIGLRLLAAVSFNAKSATESSCAPLPGASDPEQPAFSVPSAGTWTFAWEQQQWKLARARLPAPRHGASFIESATGSSSKKKWTPSLKSSP